MQTSTKYKTPKIERISLREWGKGVITDRDDGRTPQDGLRSAGNLVLDQDGTLRPRPSLLAYGEAAPGTILGEVFEFVETTTTGSTNWEIAMMNVAGTTRPYVRKDGDAWQATTGKTYDNDARAHFCQIDNKVLVMNGEDDLSYFDITTVNSTITIVPFTAVLEPAAPTVTKTGLASTTYTYYYAITANSTVGETAASATDDIQVSLPRESWDSASNYVSVAWSSVTDAQSYNVYMGVSQDQMFLIASGINGLSLKDDGSWQKDVSRIAPVTNSTAGPKTSRGVIINGQVFMTGDKDNPRYVWFGGYGDQILDFSPFGGGGNIELGRGTKEFPVVVKPFRDGRGAAQITVLCRGTNGMGKRYILSRNSITAGDTTIDFMEATEDNGQAGTDSPDAVVLYNDSLWYPSRDGFKTTGTKPQLQNILSTDRVSNTIQRDIASLNNSAMANAVGLGFESKIYYCLPVGTDMNSEIWVLDLEQKGAWMKPWDIAADWMWLYNDNDGVTHLCVLVDNEISELTYSQSTNDNGTPFATSATSGIINFSEDGQEWAKVIDVTFVLQRPQGTINVSVSGYTEDEPLTTVGSESYNPETSVSGWSETDWENYLGWADSSLVPVAFGDARASVVLEIDEELKWWRWNLDTQESGVGFQLSDIIMRFVRIGTKDES